MVVLLGAPLFVMVSPTGGVSLPAGSSIDDRGNLLGVPISVALVAILIFATRPSRRRLDRAALAAECLVIFAFVNVVAFVVGSLVYGFSFLSLAYLVQTFLPLLGFVAGRRIGQFDHQWVYKNLLRMAMLTLAAYFGVALTTLAHGGHPWVYVGEALGPFPIPQARRYLPTVVAFALILVCRSRMAGRLTPTRLLAAGAILVFLLASHSRTALVILAAAFVMFVVLDVRARVTHRINFILLACIAAGLLWTAWSSLDLQNAPEALSRFSSSDASAQVSTNRRIVALRHTFDETLTSPLGRMYRATESETLGGTSAAYARISDAENQVGEYGLRAGPLAVAAIAVAIGSVLVRSRASLRSIARRAPAIEALWLATCATIVGSVLTQQSLSEPYTGVVLWFGLGVLYAWSDRLAGSRP